MTATTDHTERLKAPNKERHRMDPMDLAARLADRTRAEQGATTTSALALFRKQLGLTETTQKEQGVTTTKEQGVTTHDTDTDFAPGWRPQPGDILSGTVVSLDHGENQYGAYPIVTVMKDSGELVAIHGFHTTLRNALRRARPVPGDKVSVKYLGLAESKSGGASYHNYRFHKSIDPTAFWGPPPLPADFDDEPPF